MFDVQEPQAIPIVDGGGGGGGLVTVPDPLEVNDATVFNLLQAGNAIISNQLRVGGNSGLLFQNNTISSGSNIIVTPTGEFQINPNLQVYGDYTRLDTVETRITDQVPVIGYIDELDTLNLDSHDRGLEFNYTTQIGPTVNFNRGFIGYDKSRDRFVLWKQSLIDSGLSGEDQNYVRTGTSTNVLDIDELYTAVIRNPDYLINGSPVNDILIEATSSLTVSAPNNTIFNDAVIANSVSNSVASNQLIFTSSVFPTVNTLYTSTSNSQVTAPLGPAGVVYYDGSNLKGVTDAPVVNDILKFNGVNVVWAPESGGAGGSEFTTDSVQTTNNVVTTLSLITVPANSTIVVKSTIASYRTDSGTEGAGFTVQTTCRNNSGVLTQIQTDIVSKQRESYWFVSTSVSGSNLLVQVQGETGKTIEWVNSYYIVVAPYVSDIGGIFITDSVQTINATTTTVTSFSVPINKTAVLVGTVSAHRSDTNTQGAGFTVQATYRNTAGVVTQIQTDIVADQAEDVWQVQTISVGVSLNVQVTGQIGQTIDWVHTYYVIFSP